MEQPLFDEATSEEAPHSKQRGIIWTVAVLAVFLIGIVALLLLTKGDSAGSVSSSPVYINEVVSSNGSYPNADGVFCDFIELYNCADHSYDLSGYHLTDKAQSIKFTFPDGTVIESQSYLLVSCVGDEREGGLYAPFSISKDGGEVLSLLNSQNIIIDQITTVALSRGQSMARAADGGFSVLDYATPLYANSEEGYASYLAARTTADLPLRISELMSSNLSSIADADGEFSDWIELTNYGDTTLDLSSFFLSDDGADPYAFQLPYCLLDPGESIVIFCSGKDKTAGDEIHTSFRLSSDGETVYLMTAGGSVCDMVEFPALPANYSYMRDGQNGAFFISRSATPGSPATDASLSAAAYTGLVGISEICASNAAGIRDTDGDWSDWIELTNFGNKEVSLQGLWLSKDTDDVFNYALPDITLAPGAALLVFASGKSDHGGEYHASFKLSQYGETVSLYTRDGVEIDALSYTSLDADHAIYRVAFGGEAAMTVHSTPGYANSETGFEAYMSSMTVSGPLQINEVMVANNSYMPQAFGKCYDFVELKNISDSAVLLSDYYLTDDSAHPTLWLFPAVTLDPGAYYIVYCSGDESLTTSAYTHSNFKLNAAEDRVYLFDAAGNAVDYAYLADIPPQASYGRMTNAAGFFYFETPTPKAANTGGVRTQTAAPTASTPAGVYNELTALTVELSGPGDIYYTLDGSWPDRNAIRYDGPILLAASTVIRAIAYEDNRFPSDTQTLGYFLSENHTLPILSLSVNPDDMFSDSTGIYVKGNASRGNYYADWEKRANLTYYALDGGGFTIDCGLKMFGGGSRASDTKKSLKVMFRGVYGQSVLHYDLFDGCSVTAFTSLVIRAGEDYRYTIFRNELFTDLAQEAGTLLTQAHRHCILYVNGEYFGIFDLKEHFSEDYYAAHYNVTPESVTLIKASGLRTSDYYDVILFARNEDMSIRVNYDYVCSLVDMDNLIDWVLFQGYMSNTDIHNNVRYIRSSEGDGKWRCCFYDLDWTFRKADTGFELVFDDTNITFALARALKNSPYFIDAFCKRMQELSTGVLSDKHVLERIDYYDKLLAPERARDRAKWYVSLDRYTVNLERMRNILIGHDRWGMLKQSLKGIFNLSSSQYRRYFG